MFFVVDELFDGFLGLCRGEIKDFVCEKFWVFGVFLENIETVLSVFGEGIFIELRSFFGNLGYFQLFLGVLEGYFEEFLRSFCSSSIGNTVFLRFRLK